MPRCFSRSFRLGTHAYTREGPWFPSRASLYSLLLLTCATALLSRRISFSARGWSVGVRAAHVMHALGASRSVLAMWGVNRHGGDVVWALLSGNIRTSVLAVSVLAVLLPFLVYLQGMHTLRSHRLINSKICGAGAASGRFPEPRALVGSRLRGFLLQSASNRRRA